MAERTIFLKNERGILRQEGIADAAIVPGMLVQLSSDGKYDPHGTAKGFAHPEFAFEQELVDGADVDTAYAQNDRLYTGVCAPGVEVYALVAASAAAIVKGDYLESAGDGTLRKKTAFSQLGSGTYAVTTEGHVVARAQEDVDNSANGASRARIIVMVV